VWNERGRGGKGEKERPDDQFFPLLTLLAVKERKKREKRRSSDTPLLDRIVKRRA